MRTRPPFPPPSLRSPEARALDSRPPRLVELYEELELSVETLLHAVHHVDRFLSTQTIPKETLQLVGAVALMLAANHFCRLPHQDGERPSIEHGLNHAQDIVYWTDGTYTMREVYEMEARLLCGFEVGAYDSAHTWLCLAAADSGLAEPTVALAAELVVVCAREYALLCLQPKLLAACVLHIAVRCAPDAGQCWSDGLAARCGYETAFIVEHVARHFEFLDGVEVSCKRLAPALAGQPVQPPADRPRFSVTIFLGDLYD